MNSAFRDFLYRPGDLAKRLAELLENYAVLDSSCKSMTANYNKIGSSGSGGDSCDAPLASIADLKSKIDLYGRWLADAEADITQFCTLMKKRDAQILRYRYVLRLPWGAILEAMQAKGYQCSNLRTLFYWHTSALTHAKKLWEDKYYAVANKREPERRD